MSDLIERMAKALCQHDQRTCWETHTDDARRALEAIRNPDMNTVLQISRLTGLQCAVIDMGWTAMIDKALE